MACAPTMRIHTANRINRAMSVDIHHLLYWFHGLSYDIGRLPISSQPPPFLKPSSPFHAHATRSFLGPISGVLKTPPLEPFLGFTKFHPPLGHSPLSGHSPLLGILRVTCRSRVFPPLWVRDSSGVQNPGTSTTCFDPNEQPTNERRFFSCRAAFFKVSSSRSDSSSSLLLV